MLCIKHVTSELAIIRFIKRGLFTIYNILLFLLLVCLFVCFCLSPIEADTTLEDNNLGYQTGEYAGIGGKTRSWIGLIDMVNC